MSEKKRQWFGTDGIRGAYGSACMNPEFIYRCGQAAGDYFKKDHAAPLFIIGRDTRQSGVELEAALVAGLKHGGAQVRCIGVLPTAAISLLTKHYLAAAGVMISASHNEYSDNGIKFFGSTGCKLTDQDEMQLEERIANHPETPWPKINAPIDFSHEPEAFEIYAAALIESLPNDFSLKGMTLLVDTANGAAWESSPKILRRLGAEVRLLAAEPTGKNINAGCGSLHPEGLQALLKEHPSCMGLCHDGDADRMVLVDENAEVLDGDELLAIIGSHWIGLGCLPKNTLVATVMSNLGLDEALRKVKGHVVRSNVGDRYVLEAMNQEGYTLGGEQSGHMLFLDILPTGDGLLSALQILNVMVAENKPLSELRQVMRKYPQKLFNLKVLEKKPLEKSHAVQAAIQRVEKEMGAQGRLLLRYSGTENKLRLLIEYIHGSELERLAETILEPIRAELN